MSSQFSATRAPTGARARPPPPQSVTYETRTIGSHEKIQLLRAPSIETDKIWKNRAFKYAYSRLRPKLCTRLDNDYKPETLITVFSDHFPLATQNAEHEADEAVRVFRDKLQDVSYLTPLGFYDVQGVRQCHRMTKKTRPANVTYLKIASDIPMGEIAPAFDGKSCHLEYFLHIPQDGTTESFRQISHTNFNATSSDRVDIDQTVESNTSSMFSNGTSVEEVQDEPVSNSSIFDKVTSSPKKRKKSSSNKEKKKKREDSAVSPQKKASTHTVFHDEKEEDGYHAVKTFSDALEEEHAETSNDSFDIESIQRQAPKLAAMLMQGRHSKTRGYISTYNGPLDILDDQQTYEYEIARRFEPFDLKPDGTGVKRMIDYAEIERKIKHMCLEIKFEAFCNEFRNDYVGDDNDAELMSHTVDRIREDLAKIRMIYLNKSTGRTVYTSPETVFKKMNAFIELLPSDASGWSFCLPWLFFAALPNDLQEEMKTQGFTRPPVATLNTKKLQSRALSQCRDSAVKAYNKLQETKKDR